MRGIIIALVVAGIATGGFTAYLIMPNRTVCPPEPSGEFASGPQVGSKIGTFSPLNLNGPDAGDDCCIFCKYGNSPVAIVFATRPSEGLAALAAGLERVVEESKATKVGVCIVVTDTGEATKSELRGLADKEKYRHVVLSVIDGKELENYALNPDAEVTVLLASQMVVRVNRAIRKGELSHSVLAEVAASAASHFAAK